MAAAVALVGGGSDVSEAANRLGLPAELLAESETYRQRDEIYPDNVVTVMVFADMLTQWRTGVNGPTGLDYGALPVVMRVRRVKLAEREEVFDGVRVMERAALKAIRER